MMNNKISLIIPTHNRPKMLERAIKSVLAQEYQNFEIIVINDKGDDVSEIIGTLQDKRIKYYVTPKNLGLAGARNFGLSYISGDFIGFLDDDDILYPLHFTVLLDIIKKNPDYAGAYTDSIQSFYDENNGLLYKKTQLSIDWNPELFRFENYIHVLSYLLKRKIVEELGGFDPVLASGHEDYDFLIRLCQKHKLKHHRQNTSEYFRHFSSSLLGYFRDPKKAAKQIASYEYLTKKHGDFFPSISEKKSLMIKFYNEIFKTKHFIYGHEYEKKKILLWGSGDCARLYWDFLEKIGLKISFVAEKSSFPHTSLFNGQPVIDIIDFLDSLNAHEKEEIYVIICSGFLPAKVENLKILNKLQIKNCLLAL